METRKLQRVGHGTLVISLPNEWVKKYGLKPKDKVRMEIESDGSISLRPEDAASHMVQKRCTIHAAKCSNKELLLRLIVGAYLMGYDNIVIVGLRDEQRSEVWDGIKMLTGLVLVDQSEARASLQSFISVRKYNLSSLLKRLFMLNEEMYSKFAGLLSGKKEPILDYITKLGEESDRIYFLAVRQIILAQTQPSILQDVGVKAQQHLLGNRIVALGLENVNDILEDIVPHASDLLKMDIKKVRDSIALLSHRGESIWRSFKESYEAFEKEDIDMADNVITAISKVNKAIESDIQDMLKKEMDAGAIINIHTILYGYKSISEWAEQIAKMTINRSLIGGDVVADYITIDKVVS